MPRGGVPCAIPGLRATMDDEEGEGAAAGLGALLAFLPQPQQLLTTFLSSL